MSNSFSFSRLLLLIKKQWIENARFYLYATLALIGMMGIIFLLWMKFGGTQYREGVLIQFFFIGIFIAGTVFASTGFSMLGNKPKGTYWLTFPASHLEKLICVIFYNFIVFTAVYVAIFFSLEKAAVAYVQNLVSANPFLYRLEPVNWTGDAGNWQMVRILTLIFLAVQALYLLGSVYFKRNSFILTTLIGAILVFLFVLFIQRLLKNGSISFFDKSIHLVEYMKLGQSRQYALNATVSQTIFFLVKYMWAPFLWIVTWYRLKEKEI